MYGHHTSSRRRKKRPMGHGIKNVQVSRGRSGYGFTISGQHPCVLSCIVGGSPADLAGLKAGDYLYFVNGVNVSHAPHDDVVRMVGQSTGTLDLQVAENYNSSDSSEDDYPPRSKSRYPNRVRFRQPQGEGAGRGGIASRPLPQRPVDIRGGHGRPHRNHVPVGAESDLSTSVTSPGSSLSEERSRHEYTESMYARKRPVYERIGRHFNNQNRLTDSSTTDVSGEGFAFTMATVQNGPVISTAKISSAVSKRPPSRSQAAHANQTNDPPANHSSGSADSSSLGAVGGALAAAGGNAEIAEREEDDDAVPPLAANEARALVGYIGSIELPGNLNRPNQQLQQLRNAVRRLRVEQKIHTMVLMEVDSSGVRLSNGIGGTMAHYTVDKLAFSGICPDDKRFFGIVTLNNTSDDVSEISGNADGSPSSSCHVFMVDPDMCSHVLHSHKAKAFNLVCTPSPNSQRCMEFPHSPTHLILCIANLYRDRPRTKLDSDIIQSHAFADPSRPPERSSSNSSNSDSGLGFGREEPPSDQVCVVDMPVDAAANGNGNFAGGNVASRNVAMPGVASSRSLGSLQQHISPGAHSFTTPRSLHRPVSAFEVRRGLNNSSSSEECWAGQGHVDKLTPRAMPDPATRRLPRATSTDGLERNPSAENLRQSMQRLLQARQQQLQHEQAVSSDSESQVSSNVHHSDPFSARSAFQVPRPVSAPLRSRGRQQQAETVDMGFGKLSPRALQQPGHLIRSPSAPPIPYFPHHDSDEDDDDTESEDDPFVRTIISQFNRDRVLDFGDDNPRRYSEGYALGKQREKERAEIEDLQKWTKTSSFRRSHNMKLKGNISQSHESLAVGEGEGALGHKLVGANSVNSIVPSHGAVEEESGRVAGWAVGFPRLLADPAGLNIFTEFLRKEFSEENIVFWSAVEAYKQIIDVDVRWAKAREIYNTHLSSQASEPVNVDSTARQLTQQYLDNPIPNMFDVAQQQILQLMRTDSYSRFLKSDLYKDYLMREMEGHTLSLPNTTSTVVAQEDVKKKGKGKENEEKRRRSLLPWRQNKKSSVKESKGKGKDKDKDKEVNNNLKKAPGPGIDLSTMRKEVFQPKEADTVETGATVKFCRVVMPDTSTTVVCTRPGHNIRNVLGKLCEKRSLSIASVDVFLLGSDKPLDLEEDISTLGSKEVVIERRVLFRLDLPNHKSIGVKAKPNRSIRDVFKPILNKYGHRIDSCGVQLSGLSEYLDLDIPVSDLDNQRVIVIANPENAENSAGPAPQQQAPLPSRHRRTPLLHLPSRSRGAGGKSGSLEEITNQIFDDLMKGKSELAHTFDELGVVDLERGGGKAHKNPDEHRSLGLFGLLRKESWGAKDTTKPKSKGRVTFALPRSDSKKKKAAKAEEEKLAEEVAFTHSQHLEEEQRGTVDSNANTFPDFLASDCVETVDMAPYAETQAGFSASGELVGREDGENRLLPPPDMFDDVHYMHSGPADGAHLADLEGEEVIDDLAPPISAHQRSTPRFSTFGTPRSKAATSNGNPAPRKGAALTSVEDSNPYLPMHPVIVDSRGPRKEEPHSRLNADLQTLGETISPHFDGALSFRPPRGSVSAPVASPEKVSPEKSQVPASGKVSATEVPPQQLRPVPARRRLLESSTSSGKAASPRAAKPDVVGSVPSELSSAGQGGGTQRDVTNPRGLVTTSDSRASPPRHSAKSGAALEKDASSHTSTPSPTLPPSSAVLSPGVQQETTPRYNPPPSYSAAVGHRQVPPGPTKSPPAPAYTAGTPVISSRTSSPAGTPPQRGLANPGSQAPRSSNFREPSPQEGFHRAKETPRDGASSVSAQNRNGGSLSSREAPAPDQVSGSYSAADASQNGLSSFKPRDAPQSGSPCGGRRMPRENMASPLAGGRELVTPRDHPNSYGVRPTPKDHSSAHGTARTPRDSAGSYGGGWETPLQAQQGWSRNSVSWDSVLRGADSVASPRNVVRDYVAGTPRGGALNGHVVHPSYTSASPKGFHNQAAAKKNSLLSPREPARHWSQSVDALSPRQQSQAPGGQSLDSASSQVAVEVHHQPDLQSDVRPYSRPLSRTFDSPRYSEQTVTFV